MRKIWRSYLAFVPMLCRMIAFAILPMISVGVIIWMGGSNSLMPAVGVMCMVLLASIVLDTWCFGGISKKEIGMPEYIKSAPKGMQFMRNAFLGSAIAPVVIAVVTWLLAIFLLYFLFATPLPDWYGIQIVIILLCGMESLYLIAVLVSRFFDGLWINVIISYVATILFSGWIALVPILSEKLAAWYLPSSVLLTALTGMIYWKVLRKCMEDNYYDNRH